MKIRVLRFSPIPSFLVIKWAKSGKIEKEKIGSQIIMLERNLKKE